jgi:hypothetical protein
MIFAITQATGNCSDSGVGDSGCCVAHGGDASLVGQTWQQILTRQSITSILGNDLHSRLVTQANIGGGWVEYAWAKSSGIVQTKRAWASRFRKGKDEYYVAVEYFKTAPPPTCDACPAHQECTQPTQQFCNDIPPTFFEEHSAAVIVGVIAAVVLGIVGVFYFRTKRKNSKLQAQMTEMEVNDNELEAVTKQLETAQRKQKELLAKRAQMQEVPATWNQNRPEILVEIMPNVSQLSPNGT